MQFLLDNSVSPLLASLLADDGHDALHMRAIMPTDSTDESVFEAAARLDRVLIAADVDFGALLANRSADRPSVVLFRRQKRSAADLHVALREALLLVESELAAGAMVVIGDASVRVRRLPIV